MAEKRVFFLGDAEISCWKESTATPGTPDISQPVFLGVCAESLSLGESPREIEVWPTGATHPLIRHAGSVHSIRIDRLWAPEKSGSTLSDYRPQQNQRLVLRIEWEDAPGTPRLRRDYTGVVGGDWEVASNGVLQFNGTQAFRAENYTQQEVS